MPTVNHNPKASQLINDYIAKSPDFSQAICKRLRSIIFSTDPEIIEDWKWGPNYYKNGMLCGFGAFKGWVTFSFFQGALMKDSKKLFNYGDTNAHNRSIKFTDVSQIDEKVLTSYLKEAIAINDSGKALKINNAKDKKIPIPTDLHMALRKEMLLEKFEKLPYTQRKEYIELVEIAKKEETRKRRLQSIINMLSK